MDPHHEPATDAAPSNFIRDIIDADLKSGRRATVVTRFPPEPNGYLHIGHAKSIVLNFGLAEAYGGTCNLRFDDTNPETEDIEYVNAHKRDIRWLGYDWGTNEYYASDYFEQLYDWAVDLVKKGKAYVDDLDEEQIRDYRGTVTEPGRESPYRGRSVEENLDLLGRMRRGEFPDGAKVLRAKIDMASPNMLLRDPIMYRIRHATHYRRGDAWCIYPMYDWAHGQSDAIEDITHSICTLEFEVHRPLYDWFIDSLGLSPRPYQYEFARLNLDYTITSKRKLLQLVREGFVTGWDDPRMPTIAGLRRRGVTPAAIRTFAERIGVTRVDSRVDIGIFEHSLRDDLNYRAPRVMAVLDPLKVVLTNVPEDHEEELAGAYWPHDIPREGTRPVPFTRTLYIERDDFALDPPKKYKRLAPGRAVRLRHGYVITCDEAVTDEAGTVTEVRCSIDPDTLDANPDYKVWGVIHWVSAPHSIPAEVRLYDRLFRVSNPDEGEADFKTHLNPDSLVVLTGSRVEPSVLGDPADTRYQFERQGYFWQDPVDSSPGALVFNRIIPLRDSWAKLAQASTGDGHGKAAAPPAETARATAPEPAAPDDDHDPVADLTSAEKARYDRYAGLGLETDDALILARDRAMVDFFEDALAAHNDPQAVANWVIHELRRVLKDTPVGALPFDGTKFGKLVALIDDGTLSGRLAKDVFETMLQTGDDPEAIVEAHGLTQITDASALAPIVDRLLAAYPDKVDQYRDGKTGLLGFFVGQVMRETQGKANPQLVQELVRQALD